MSVGVGRVGRSVGFLLIVCLSVCLFVHSVTKTNDPKVFKLGLRNDHGIP